VASIVLLRMWQVFKNLTMMEHARGRTWIRKRKKASRRWSSFACLKNVGRSTVEKNIITFMVGW
jgi:hypothetical protein